MAAPQVQMTAGTDKAAMAPIGQGRRLPQNEGENGEICCFLVTDPGLETCCCLPLGCTYCILAMVDIIINIVFCFIWGVIFILAGAALKDSEHPEIQEHADAFVTYGNLMMFCIILFVLAFFFIFYGCCRESAFAMKWFGNLMIISFTIQMMGNTWFHTAILAPIAKAVDNFSENKVMAALYEAFAMQWGLFIVEVALGYVFLASYIASLTSRCDAVEDAGATA